MNWHLLPLLEISQLLNPTPAGIDSITTLQRLAKHRKNKKEEKK